MTLRDKKFIPYYIAGAVILILAVIFVLTLTLRGGVNRQPETTTEEPTVIFMNGDVPYYPNIAASAYDKSAFALDDEGRMTYTDSHVKQYTGIDVSSHQQTIDWDTVAEDGIDFAMIRVGFRGYGTAGNILEDDTARSNLRGAAAAGLKVGVYFFSQAITREEAVEEAQFVLDIIEDYDIDFPVVFDWENEPSVAMRTDDITGDMLTACAKAFCEEIDDAGYIPAVYFNLNDAYIRYDLDEIKQYPFWYAQHEGAAPEFYYNYTIWQYSDTGSVAGIKGNVDLNISFSDFSNYKAKG